MVARSKSPKRNIVIAGFSGVGKTTFLAALWHVLSSPREVPSALTLASRPKEAEHLNALRDKWQSCEKVPHTFMTSEHILTLDLAQPDGTWLGALVLPDISGESFSAQWSQRQAPSALAEMVREACGVLLLVHATAIEQPERLRDRDGLASSLNGDSDGDSVEAGTSATATADAPDQGQEQAKEVVPWSPELTGTDVQLVDLLQLMCFQRGERSDPLPLALGISAWDLTGDRSPMEWLQSRMPLLQQYLDANPDVFRIRLYGISAQGGDYAKGTDDLLEKAKPSDRINIVGEGCAPHDITAPIAWLLSN